MAAIRRSGKVRELYPQTEEDRLLLVTTDRLSAFDRVLAEVPHKGQILNQISAWWFGQTGDIVPNHLLEVVDPQAMIVRKTSPLPLEIIVRGYLTGVTSTSLGQLYASGQRRIYGYTFPDGLSMDQLLPEPLITPTTKAQEGAHDERVDHDQVVPQGLLSADLWKQVQQAALSLYQRGLKLAQKAGLVLVDTKYEFGLDSEGRLLLIDEVHTPDSSRYWLEGENFDKEFIRKQYAARGYRGEGPPPELPGEIWEELGRRYAEVYRRLLGHPVLAPAGTWQERLHLS